MKINKKQIIMLSLSLVVCLAVFLNWRLIEQNELAQDQVSEVQNDVDNTKTESEQDNKILGEAQFVSSAATSVEEYFTSSRLSRRQSKDEAIELLNGFEKRNEFLTELLKELIHREK